MRATEGGWRVRAKPDGADRIGGIGTPEGPIVGTLLYFALRQGLADHGGWYLRVLGAVAIAVMVWWPKGIWSTLQARYDVSLFPTRARLSPALEHAEGNAAAPGAPPNTRAG